MRVKARFVARTNKQNATRQIAEQDLIEFHVRRIASDVREYGIDVPGKAKAAVNVTSPEVKYHIAVNYKVRIPLGPWLMKLRDDCAVDVCVVGFMWCSVAYHLNTQNFVLNLREHLHSRLLEPKYERYKSAECMDVLLKDEVIYEHPIARFNYTTYDLQRDQDIIHPTHDKMDILVYAPENGHSQPWEYARVLKVYHANVYTLSNTTPERMEFLWVRWFERDNSAPTGPQVWRLDHVSFVPSTDDRAFGFVDPASVIRGCHLIPAFARGRTFELLGPSIARDPDGDWAAFDVMMYATFNLIIFSNLTCLRFSDRDLVARFTGIAVGHPDLKATQVTRLICDDVESEFPMDYATEVPGTDPSNSANNSDAHVSAPPPIQPAEEEDEEDEDTENRANGNASEDDLLDMQYQESY